MFPYHTLPILKYSNQISTSHRFPKRETPIIIDKNNSIEHYFIGENKANFD